MASVEKTVDVGKLSQKERVELAEDHHAPVNILVQLANDEDHYVRFFVAANPKTPINVLAKLADDVSERVRLCVFENPNKSLLRRLEVIRGPTSCARNARFPCYTRPSGYLARSLGSPPNAEQE